MKLLGKYQNIGGIKSVIISVLLIFQPVFFLLTVYNQVKLEEMGNKPGIIFLGVILGFIFIKIRAILKPDLNSAAGIIFLFVPFILYLLTSIETGLIINNFNTNFFWLIFLSVYLAAGAVLFIKNNPLLYKTELYIITLCVPFLILALIINFMAAGIHYSPDSYGYYDMSKLIFKDFGRVSVIRQYVEFTDYGISFPYLFPFLIAVFNLFTGFGMLSGTIINITAMLISFYYILKISVRLSRSAIPGLIVSVVLFFNSDYLSEMINARAVPLSVLCVLLIINIIGSGKISAKELFFAGLIAGAGMVIRFDFFVIPALLGLIFIFIFIFKKNIFRLMPFYALGILVFTAPWIIYSLVHFNSFWISDNSGTLFMVHPQIPQRFFLPDEIVPDFFNDFTAWFQSRQNIILRGLANFFVIFARPVELIMLLGVAGTGILSKNMPDGTDKKLKIVFIFTVLIYTAKTLAIILVGYADLRYHTEALLIVSLVLLCSFYIKLANHKIWALFIIFIFSAAFINNFQPSFRNNVQPKLLSAFINTEAFTPDDETKEIERLLMEHSEAEKAGNIRLFYIGGSPYKDPYLLGAYSDIKAFARITNIDEYRLLYLMRNYIKPDYIYALENEKYWVDILRENYLIDIISDSPPLYSVTAMEPLDAGSIRANSLSDSSWSNGTGIYSPVILFRNSDEIREKLENAAGFEAGGIYLRVGEIIIDEYWIYAEFAPGTNLSPFAYPNEIIIRKTD